MMPAMKPVYLLAIVALAACTAGALGRPVDGGVQDLVSHDASPAVDLASQTDLATSPDFSLHGTHNCLQIVTCAGGCGLGSPCIHACVVQGTPTAQVAFNTLEACAYSQCTIAADGGSSACTSSTDQSPGCITCATAAAQSAACSAQLMACLST